MIKQFSTQNSPVALVDATHNNFLTLSTFSRFYAKLVEGFSIGHVRDAVFRVKSQTLREHDITCPTVEQKQPV